MKRLGLAEPALVLRPHAGSSAAVTVALPLAISVPVALAQPEPDAASPRRDRADGDRVHVLRDGSHRALTWTGASGQYVEVYRDNALLGPTVNSGSFPDVLNTSGGTFAYKVCERGTTNCSNTASVTF